MQAEGKRSQSVPNLKGVCSKVTAKDLGGMARAGGQLSEAGGGHAGEGDPAAGAPSAWFRK